MLADGSALSKLQPQIGSNAYAFGKEATENGRGLVYGNPHFPWDGSERLYQTHLKIPGKVDVAGALALRGAAGPDRPHARARLVAHGRHGLALHAVQADRSAPTPTPTSSTESSRTWRRPR